MSTPLLSPQTALDYSVRIAAVGSAISALEMLCARQIFHRTGIVSLPALAPLYSMPRFLRIVHTSTPHLLALQGLSSALLVLAGPYGRWGPIALLSSICSNLLVRWRRYAGGDGAEQMTTIIFMAGGAVALAGCSPAHVSLGVIFVGAQSALAYVTAGAAKAASAAWRGGGAITEILGTSGHGHPLMFRVLGRRPALGFVLCWSVIGFELLFPLALFGPSSWRYTLLVAGTLFHTNCAALMGLNSFTWAFIATYPCVLATESSFTSLLQAG